MGSQLAQIEIETANAELLQSDRDILRLLGPHKAVAFVGSKRLSALQQQQFARYGDIRKFIVNPKGGDVGDIPVLPSVLSLPDEVELVIIKVGPSAVTGIIEDCGKRGIQYALVFTDGYSEVGPDGAAAERELARIARQNRVRILGPNTNDNVLESYSVPANHNTGRIALITQSGASGRSVVEGVEMGASFYRWVTTGNEVDLEVADFIHHFAAVADVAVIALYVEGFKKPEKLKIALDRAMRAGKPVVALKIGATEGGVRAAISHTGHLAGEDAVINGLFRQFGVTRVKDIDELLETANMFSKVPIGAGSRCAMYTVSGGTAALMAENAELNDLELPPNSQDLCELIHKFIPRNLNVANPIDNGGMFLMTSDQGKRLAVLDLIASNPDVDLIVIGVNSARGALSEHMAADILSWAPSQSKPVIAIWASVVTDTAGHRDLVNSGVPIFRSFTKCMNALGARQRYLRRRACYVRPMSRQSAIEPQLTNALDRGGTLTAQETSSLLRGVGISVAKEVFALSVYEVREAAIQIGFPLVLKLAASAISHKTDRGLVRLNINSIDQAEATAAELFEIAQDLNQSVEIDGLLVQEQIPNGIEMIIGLTRDAQFGSCLSIGAGGIYAEVLKDIATIPLPASAQDILEMIDGLRIAPLLNGVRGAPPADKDALIQLAMKIADLGQAAGPRITELDLNPAIVLPHGVVVVDALVLGKMLQK